MDHHSNQMDNTASTGKSASSNTIDFNSVIDLRDYAGKNAKIEIDSSINERNMSGKGGHEQIVAKEAVKVTENGKPVSEHVLNNLILTDSAHGLKLNDNTFVLAGAKHDGAKHDGAEHDAAKYNGGNTEAPLKAFGSSESIHKERESGHAADEAGDAREKASENVMAKIELHPSGHAENQVAKTPTDEKSKSEEHLSTEKNILPNLALFDSKK